MSTLDKLMWMYFEGVYDARRGKWFGLDETSQLNELHRDCYLALDSIGTCLTIADIKQYHQRYLNGELAP